MSYQIHDYGKEVAELTKTGHSAGRQGIPVGAYHDDGHTRYRWAFLKEASVVTPGKVMVENGFLGSAAALSGSHFVSAVEQFGGANATKIHVHNASLLSQPTRYENGTFEVLSGAKAPFVVGIESIEQGAAGKRTRISLQGELPFGLSTSHCAIVRPNKYWGVKFPDVILTASIALEQVGATTASAVTSGYQLLVTRGVGFGFQSADLDARKLIAGGLSGVIQCGSPGGSSAMAMAVGRMISPGNEAKKFVSVDWFFE